METTQYVRSIERLIAEQQAAQQVSHPSTPRWQDVSREIHRLAGLIVAAWAAS